MSSLDRIKTKFSGQISVEEKTPRRIYITVAKAAAFEVVRYCFCDLGARFSIASGVDTRAGVEILYHMSFDKEHLLITVRTLVEKPELEMPSFTDFMPAVNWIEREISEMFGVKFSGHPNLTRLLLSDDWPEGEYPYRKKTFESEKEGV